jgi:proline dehydrogenase
MNYKFMQRASRRFVAGERLDEALEVAKGLNSHGILATLDHLGEHITSETEASAACSEYLKILEHVKESQVKSNISLKPTQMGMDLGFELCYAKTRAIAEQAQRYHNFLRIDMESSAYTDRTLEVYRRLRGEGFSNVGVVIQAYLFRSAGDIERLCELGANVRLCKGAYQEPTEIAFPQKKDVDANFLKLIELMLSVQAQQKGAYAALATHDEKIIDWAKLFTREREISPEKFEFQMLHGIRRDLQQQLVQEGYRVRVYVSYGTHWYPYFMRRLAERPANLFFLAKNLIRG